MDSCLWNGRLGAMLVVAALALAAPATASAAYAPKLALSVNPTTPGALIALTSTITQGALEDANRDVRVSFPVGFAFDITALQGVQACTPQQFAGATCPEGSRLGRATADTPLGTFNGGVFLGVFPKLYVTLSNGISLFDQKLEGRTEFRPDSGVDTIFEGLPDVPTTRFVLALDGPPKSVIVAPAQCGVYEFVGRFTSQNGGKAESRSTVEIAGSCPAPPFAASSVRMSPRTVRQGRTTKLLYTLSEAATVEVRVRRSRTRRIRYRRTVAGRAGANTLSGLGRRLPPGTYIITFQATTADGRVATRVLRMKIRPRPRRR